VIQDYILITDRDVRGQKVPDGPHDSRWGKVTPGVIVPADHKNAGMMAVDLPYQVVQLQEVAVIAREQNTSVLGGMRKVDRIIFSS